MSKSLAAAIVLMLAGTVGATVPGTDLYVPAVGRGTGAVSGGVAALWRGDVWIFNPSTTQAATVDIYMLLRNQGNPNPTSRRITVNPGETRYLPDIVNQTFGLDNTYGGLRVVSTIPVVVSGRSYDANVTVVNKGQGTAGQFFSGVPAELAIGLGDSTDVVGLDQDGFTTSGLWRSNLAFVETTGSPVDLTVSRVDSNGAVLGSISQHLEGRQVSQINYVITTIVNTTGTNQRIRVAVTGGTGHVITNASRLDNRTGDPATIEMVGGGRAGTYVCQLDRSDYKTPLALTVDGGAVTAIDSTILFTDADVPSCTDIQLAAFSGPLSTPVYYDDNGAFSFVVSNPNVGGIGISLQVSGTITVTGQVSGTMTTTVTGAGTCSGSKGWPFAGARVE